MLITVLGVAAIVGLLYLLCYGGFEGPVDWVMGTSSHGDRDHQIVALTFDDGPDPVRTPALLAALDQLGVKATFFVVGAAVDAHPDVTRQIVAGGHELGNHTYTHRYLPMARSKAVLRELAATDRAIERATGTVPTIARPPYGGRSPRTVQAFARAAKRLVLWDVNSFDWRGKSVPQVVERVLERTRPGSIILMHEARDGGEATIEAVRLLVPRLRARGLAFATIGDL
ncbi:MAG: polysaccharide deacetylase family protein [Proteobacteria bacterium]|nr:polysaccharide deacetylase family protein [Pseudomonadota bacterium]